MERASITSIKSNPGKSAFLIISSVPEKACGISRIGSKAVVPASKTAQTDLVLLEMRPAKGINSEPIIGIKIVKRVIFEIDIV